MVAVMMRDRDVLDVGRLDADLGQLRGQGLGARCRAERTGDRLLGDGVGVARVPQQPVRAVADQVAVVGKLDGFADIDAGRPARLVGRGIVAAIHDVEPVDRPGLRQCRRAEHRQQRQADKSCLHVPLL
jgi:hypothetical protein